MTDHNHTFGVDLAYKAEYYDKDYDGIIHSAVGGQQNSSGMGFGYRDIQYDTETEEQASEIKVAIDGAGLKLEYCNVFEDNFGCWNPSCQLEWNDGFADEFVGVLDDVRRERNQEKEFSLTHDEFVARMWYLAWHASQTPEMFGEDMDREDIEKVLLTVTSYMLNN